MKIRHRAGPDDWEGVELPDDPGLLVGALPGVSDRDYGVCANLSVMGIREEQNRVVSDARRRCGKDATEEVKTAAVHKALSAYKIGCTYKPKPTPLVEALASLKKAGVSDIQIVEAVTAGMGDDAKALVKARLMK